MQNYVDPDIPSSSSSAESMRDKIDKAQDKLVKQQQSNSRKDEKDVSLYSRYWQEVLPRPSLPCNNNKEQAITISDTTTTNNKLHSSFTVATFNTLAHGLSCGPPSTLFPPPFPKEDTSTPMDTNVIPNTMEEEAYYGGFVNVSNPEVVFDWNNIRKWRLLHVLLGGGLQTSSTTTTQQQPIFDILALQEVDEYNSFFQPLLVNDTWYQGTFQPKPNSPCVPLGYYSDGVALFWNVHKFETIHRCCHSSRHVNEEQIHNDTNDNYDNDCGKAWIEQGTFTGKEVKLIDNNNDNNTSNDEIDVINVSNQVYILVPLQIIGTHKCLVVGATHLKAKSGLQNELIRHTQVMELRHRAEEMAQEILATTMGSRKEVSILLLGDFNSEPHESTVRSILCSEKKDDDSSSSKLWHYQSAYSLPPNQEKPIENENSLYTTWKIRREGEIKRIIDYIFYASSHSSSTATTSGDDNGGEGEDGLMKMQCTHVLSIPKDTDVENGRYPGYRYPSDHLLIAAKFVY
jgi:mRNA deadenylase 3'-5' endonuclease subunit Ccr4